MSAPDQAPHQQGVEQSSAANPSPLSPHFATPHVPSPPPPSSVRRHQSLTYGAHRQIPSSGLKRAGTLQQTGSRHTAAVGQTPSPPDPEEEEYAEDKEITNPYDDESYFTPRSPPPNQQQYGSQGSAQYPTSPIGRASPWGTPGGPDWRTPGGTFSGPGMASVDDVARALSVMELSNTNQLYSNNAALQGGQSTHPPRFNPPPVSSSTVRQNAMQGNGASRKLQLNTDMEGRKTPTGQSVCVSSFHRKSCFVTITAWIYERQHCNRSGYLGSRRETSHRARLQFEPELWLQPRSKRQHPQCPAHASTVSQPDGRDAGASVRLRPKPAATVPERQQFTVTYRFSQFTSRSSYVDRNQGLQPSAF